MRVRGEEVGRNHRLLLWDAENCGRIEEVLGLLAVPGKYPFLSEGWRRSSPGEG